MESLLLIVVLISVFLLHAGADIPIQADFDFEKMEGKWYPIALVLSQAEAFPSHPGNQIVSPSENGDLLFEYNFMKEEKCDVHFILLYHTDEAGKFFNRDKSNTLRMVDVNYDSYYILHVEMENSAALHLFTRKLNEIDQEKEKFKEVAESTGFSVDKINFLNEVECPA